MPPGQKFILQHIRCRVADDQLEAGTDQPESAHHVRQEIGAERRACPEPDRAAQTFPARKRQCLQGFRLFHNLTGVLQNLATARRQNSATLPTLHKWQIKRGFKTGDLLAERWLAASHPLGGLAVLSGLRKCDEVSQLPKRHLLLHDLLTSMYFQALI